jgi:hypothetical protein
MSSNQGVTLTLTVNEKLHRIDTRHSDEGYGSSSPKSAFSTLPMTVSEDIQSPFRSPSRSGSEGRKFRLPWTGGGITESEGMKRLDKEKEAEDFISSLSGRSLTIQLGIIEKILNKEKRKVKFGLSSNKIMDLAIRRYSYKYSPHTFVLIKIE